MEFGRAFQRALMAVVFLFLLSIRAQDSASSPGDRFIAGEAMTIAVALDTAAFIRGGYPIDSLGYADLPVLGRINVGGKTRDEVETYLGEKLSNYLKDTHVKAEPAMRITWLGYFVKAGQYYVNPSTTVWEAVRMAGGIAGERTIDEIEVRRGEKTIALHFLDEYSKGSTLAGAGLKSGDIIIVPVPRDNTGFWYWFKESLSVTAQLATVATSVVSAYLLYLSVNNNK